MALAQVEVGGVILEGVRLRLMQVLGFQATCLRRLKAQAEIVDRVSWTSSFL